MATHEDISIDRGRTGTIEVTVTGITNWAAMNARLFAGTTVDGTPLITLTGTIDSSFDIVSFTYTPATTADITDKFLYYEVAFYNDADTFIENAAYGIMHLHNVVKTDATT